MWAVLQASIGFPCFLGQQTLFPSVTPYNSPQGLIIKSAHLKWTCLKPLIILPYNETCI
jgi:hypothetical protein